MNIKEFYTIHMNPVEIFGGPAHGTAFKMERACTKCGSGAEILSPLILTKAKLKRAFLMTLNGELIVSDELAITLKSNGIASFADVQQKRDRALLPWKLLLPQAILPRFSENSTGFVRENECTECHRDGYYLMNNAPLVLRYRSLKNEYLEKDILATYEKFGNSKLRTPFYESVFAPSLYVLSSKFIECLRNSDIKGYTLENVFFEKALI